MGRFKSTGFKFGQPLADPRSKRIELCYARHGKAYAHNPPLHSDVDMLVIDSTRATLWVAGTYVDQHQWRCDELATDDRWRFLGWKMADGSLPLGALEPVDPDLAQFDFLQLPHTRGAFKIVAGDGGRFIPADQKLPTR